MMVANVQGMSFDAMTSKLEECDAQDENQNVNLTKEQYGQLLYLLHHLQLGNDGENSNNLNPTNVVNFAGPFFEEALEIGKFKDGLYLLCSQCLRNNCLANNSIICSSTHSCYVNSHLLNNMHCHPSTSVNRSSLSHLQNHQCSIVNNSS
uniref:Uncharacterized protein LOC104231783 n=1 Tax=Nicotiana sylvestris TaxID=4096 RepID=A0A1U7X0F3_NICSY|nr:PREDICTED: uncharacterized protein LOC104231783 [Nicotiana sylvestris]XP_009783141.1 PREDICTED: uncharacterized protein LOC104231783 [Nicotiana sylvestris]